MEKEEKRMKEEELKKSKIFKIWMKILATLGYLDLESDKQGGFWVEPVSENNAAAHSLRNPQQEISAMSWKCIESSRVPKRAEQ